MQKLYTDRLPTLKKGEAESKDIAIWLLKLKRWSTVNGLGPHIFTPPSLKDDAWKQKAQLALRYVVHAIESESLSGDLADIQGLLYAHQAVEHIRTNWLHGRTESDTLQDELNAMVYHESMSLTEFLANFALLINHITPTIRAYRSCELFSEKLPSRYDPYTLLADEKPGRESINSYDIVRGDR